MSAQAHVNGAMPPGDPPAMPCRALPAHLFLVTTLAKLEQLHPSAVTLSRTTRAYLRHTEACARTSGCPCTPTTNTSTASHTCPSMRCVAVRACHAALHKAASAVAVHPSDDEDPQPHTQTLANGSCALSPPPRAACSWSPTLHSHTRQEHSAAGGGAHPLRPRDGRQERAACGRPLYRLTPLLTAAEDHRYCEADGCESALVAGGVRAQSLNRGVLQARLRKQSPYSVVQVVPPSLRAACVAVSTSETCRSFEHIRLEHAMACMDIPPPFPSR